MTGAYEQALKYLNMKGHSRQDLAFKLKRKGFEEAEITATLMQLEQEGLINDTAYAEIYLRNLIEYRSFGYYGIKAKLLQKRLDKSLIEELMNKMLPEEVEEAIASRFIERPVNKTRERKSLMQAMRQKGFRTSVLLKTIGTLPDAEEGYREGEE